MSYRFYKLLNKTELSAIRDKLGAACGAWSSAWLAAEPVARVQCQRAAEWRAAPTSTTTTWMVRGADPAQWVALCLGAGFNDHLGGKLIPGAGASARPSALQDELVMRALTDLLRPLCPWIAGCAPEKIAQRDALPAEARETGSGAVAAELAWDGVRLEIVFSAAHVASMLGGAPARAAASVPFARTTDALLEERLQLTVWAGEAQLELALLQTIVVGDVIKLNTRIDEPLQVLTADGSRVCNAFLGSFQGRKSIKLIA